MEKQSQRVLIVEDDAFVREAYRTFLTLSDEFELCGEASNGADGVASYARLLPDVVMMDLQMPGIGGVEAIRQICDEFPDACVIALTTFGAIEYVVAALEAGASGYLLKEVGGDGLLIGLRQAIAGEMPLSSTVRRELVGSLRRGGPQPQAASTAAGLTPREVELVTLLAQGLTNAQIARRMSISEGSAKQYLVRVSAKIGVRSRTTLLIRAVQLGVIDPFRLPLVGG